METDDLRVPRAVEIAQKQGIEVIFNEHEGTSPINHPTLRSSPLKMTLKKSKLVGVRSAVERSRSVT